MSSPNYQIIISALAAGDIDDILAYTLGEWGDLKLGEYRALIENALGLLRRNPEAGRERSDLAPNLRSLPVGSHLIFYRVVHHPEGSHVRILRILHARMDAGSHLRST